MALTATSRRSLLVYAMLAPLALVVGYLLTTPLELPSFVTIVLLASLLVLPVFLHWHHAILVFTWNAAFIVFFLPGQPSFWMLAAVVSLVFTVGNNLLKPGQRFPRVPCVTASLVGLGLVVLATAVLRGGVKIRSLGGESYGGKGYFFIWFAIAGYFALAGTRIPAHKAGFYAGAFILSGLTCVISHLIFFLGEDFYVLYAFFQPEYAVGQAMALYQNSNMVRLGGLSLACLAACYFMFMRYGVRGICDVVQHPFRAFVFVGVVAASLLGGFRSGLLTLACLFVVQAWLEKLYSSRLFPALVLGLGLGFALLSPLASHLPLSVQRSLSVLPLKLDPIARYDAEASTEWRVKMWQMLLPDVPKYLLLGKGYSFDPTDLYLTEVSVRHGFARDYETSMVVGDYHSGPLSVCIPFGLPGLLAFLVFLGASLRVLCQNYRQGDPALRSINTFLLSLFITRALFFLLLFGAISVQLCQFTGLIGLSVSLNGGRRSKQPDSTSNHDHELG